MPRLVSRRKVEEFRRAFEGEIRGLVSIYRQATLDALEILSSPAATLAQRRRALALLRQYNVVLSRMQDEAAAWIQTNLPPAYRLGMDFADEGLREIRRAGINLGRPRYEVFAQVHVEAVAAIARELQRTLDFAAAQIGRRVDDAFRQVGMQEVTRGIVEGKTRLAVSQQIKERLLAEGKPFFTDRLGRKWDLDRYTEMVARTTTREAMTQGTINRLREHGIDLAQVSVTGTPDFCLYYENVIVSIGDEPHPVYPPLSAIDGGPPFHPNCGHVMMPFVEKLATPAEKQAGVAQYPELLNTTGTDKRVHVAAMQRRFRQEFPERARAEGKRLRQQAGRTRLRLERRIARASAQAARTPLASPVRIMPLKTLPRGLVGASRAPTAEEMALVQQAFERIPDQPRSLFGENQRIGVAVQTRATDFVVGRNCLLTPEGLRSEENVRHELLHTALNRGPNRDRMVALGMGYTEGGVGFLEHAQSAAVRAGGGLEGIVMGAHEEAAMMLANYRAGSDEWAQAVANRFGVSKADAQRRVDLLRRALGWE